MASPFDGYRGAPGERIVRPQDRIPLLMKKKTYKPGTWIVLGIVLGAFIGLLFSKLALGGIFGFFLGLAIDSSRRKAISSSEEKVSPDSENI